MNNWVSGAGRSWLQHTFCLSESVLCLASLSTSGYSLLTLLWQAFFRALPASELHPSSSLCLELPLLVPLPRYPSLPALSLFPSPSFPFYCL